MGKSRSGRLGVASLVRLTDRSWVRGGLHTLDFVVHAGDVATGLSIWELSRVATDLPPGGGGPGLPTPGAVALIGLGGLAGMAGDPSEAAGAKVMPVQSIGVAITSWAARQTASAGMNLLTVALVGVIAGAFSLAVVMIYRRYGVKVLTRPAAEQGMDDIIALKWSLLIIGVLCFSPQTNSPHLVQMLIPVMVAVACLLSTRRTAVRWVVGIGCAVLVAGFVLPPGG
jgi:hypothetical protein